MNNEHDEQTKWIVSYLETRFGRLEDRIDSVADGLQSRMDGMSGGLENRIDQAILAQTTKVEHLQEKLNQLENAQLKLSNQAGIVRNSLAFAGTLVISLIGWVITYLYGNGK